MRITQRLVAVLGVIVVGWCALTAWPAIVHGHPAYAILLAVTTVAAGLALVRTFRPPRDRSALRLVGGVVLVVLAVGWLGLMAWLRPFSAVEPALAAMASSGGVTVTEGLTQIVLQPTVEPSATGVFFQPGAKVDARAYAAILRPLAEAGHTIVIAKQPLGIGFLATGAFESARDAAPQVTEWIVGGHSLGGTVASMDAEEHDADGTAPVTGLMLYASYPASDLSTTLSAGVISISGSEDGLATPADIASSVSDLPEGTRFESVEGAVHAFFGDYGPQPGDGTPTISQDEARSRIGSISLGFVSS